MKLDAAYMKPFVAALGLMALVAGCDINADAPPPADSTPAAPPVKPSAPGTTTGPGPAPRGLGKATPPPGDWLFKDYKNPLDRPSSTKK
jgi:hypothetical protein